MHSIKQRRRPRPPTTVLLINVITKRKKAYGRPAIIINIIQLASHSNKKQQIKLTKPQNKQHFNMHCIFARNQIFKLISEI